MVRAGGSIAWRALVLVTIVLLDCVFCNASEDCSADRTQDAVMVSLVASKAAS